MLKIWDIKEPSYIFHNGKIHTVDELDRLEEAVAIIKDRIFAVGNNEEILKLKGNNTKVIDLKGKSLIPGINDSHNHPWMSGTIIKGVVTFGLKSILELKEKVLEKTKELPEGTWIQGGGWIETQFNERRMPTKWDLDEVSSNHPVVLDKVFGSCVVNSKALELAGITKDTPNPQGGEIEKDPETGEPTGILHWTA